MADHSHEKRNHSVTAKRLVIVLSVTLLVALSWYAGLITGAHAAGGVNQVFACLADYETYDGEVTYPVLIRSGRPANCSSTRGPTLNLDVHQ